MPITDCTVIRGTSRELILLSVHGVYFVVSDKKFLFMFKTKKLLELEIKGRDITHGFNEVRFLSQLKLPSLDYANVSAFCNYHCARKFEDILFEFCINEKITVTIDGWRKGSAIDYEYIVVDGEIVCNITDNFANFTISKENVKAQML